MITYNDFVTTIKNDYKNYLQKLYDEKPETYEKFEDYVGDEDFKELLADESIMDAFSWSFLTDATLGFRNYLYLLIIDVIGFDNFLSTVSQVKDKYVPISIDLFKHFSDANVKIDNLNDFVEKYNLSQMQSDGRCNTEPKNINDMTIDYFLCSTNDYTGNHKICGYFLKSYKCNNLTIDYSYNDNSSMFYPIINATNTADITLDNITKIAFTNENVLYPIKKISLEKNKSLLLIYVQDWDNLVGELILPDVPEIKIIANNADNISNTFKIIKKPTTKIRCNKNIADVLRTHVESR